MKNDQGIYCSKCGRRQPAGNSFCSQCGARLILTGQQPAPPPIPETTAIDNSTAEPLFPVKNGGAPRTRFYRQGVWSRGRIVILAAVALGLIVWLAAGRHHRHAPFEQVNNPLYFTKPLRPNPKVLWAYNPDTPCYTSPILDEDRIFVYCNPGTLIALKAKTGQELWKFTVNPILKAGTEYECDESPPVTDAQSIYINGVDGVVYALEKTTGRQRWSYSTGGCIFGSPVVYNGVVYFSSDGSVYGLNSNTGTHVWDLFLGGHAVLTPYRGFIFISYATSFAVQPDYKSVIIDAKTGHVANWKKPPDFTGKPTFFGSMMYYQQSYSHTMTAYDLNKKRNIWSFPVNAPFVVNEDMLFYLSRPDSNTDDVSSIHSELQTELNAIDTRNGRKIWSIPIKTYRNYLSMTGSTIYLMGAEESRSGGYSPELTAFDTRKKYILWKENVTNIESRGIIVHEGIAWFVNMGGIKAIR